MFIQVYSAYLGISTKSINNNHGDRFTAIKLWISMKKLILGSSEGRYTKLKVFKVIINPSELE